MSVSSGSAERAQQTVEELRVQRDRSGADESTQLEDMKVLTHHIFGKIGNLMCCDSMVPSIRKSETCGSASCWACEH